MLHYIHQLDANFFCPLCGPGQAVYTGFIRAFSLKIDDESAELNQNSTFVGCKTETMNW